jgi:hypothetical protein
LLEELSVLEATECETTLAPFPDRVLEHTGGEKG